MSQLDDILNSLEETVDKLGKVASEHRGAKQQIKELITELCTTHEVLFASHEAYEEFVRIVGKL